MLYGNGTTFTIYGRKPMARDGKRPTSWNECVTLAARNETSTRECLITPNTELIRPSYDCRNDLEKFENLRTVGARMIESHLVPTACLQYSSVRHEERIHISLNAPA